MKAKVLLTRTIPKPGLDYLNKHCNVFLNERDHKLTEDEIIKRAKDCDGLACLLSDRIGERVFHNTNLKIVSNFGVGYDNIDISSATNNKVMVTNTPGVLDNTTSELAFALMLSVSRRLIEADKFVRERKWTTGWEVNMFLGLDLTNKTLGIIGMGNIGRSFAKKAGGFNMNIIYHNRQRLSREIENKYNATYVDKNTLLRESDFISLHVPNTKETHHIIAKKELSLMKSNAILINTARGTVVNEHDLYTALKEKVIWGAGLDVFEKEPKITEGLINLNNVVVLPHIASASIETRNKMSLMLANNIVLGLRGERPPNLVNKSLFAE